MCIHSLDKFKIKSHSENMLMAINIPSTSNFVDYFTCLYYLDMNKHFINNYNC